MEEDGPAEVQMAASGPTSRFGRMKSAVRRASFGGGASGEPGGSTAEMAMVNESEVMEPPTPKREITRESRNRLLALAVVLLGLDALLAIVFALLAPADPRLTAADVSRKQLRTVYMQGAVAIIDVVVSSAIFVHVVGGVLTASLDSFLDAAATKLLQATFFSLLQTGYPTVLRLTFVTLLLVIRVTSAAFIFRAAFLSGALSARPTRQIPRVILSLLEMGAPVLPVGASKISNSVLYALERPLRMELVERLLCWLVPLRERASAVGFGRRQVLLIAAFLVLMTGYSAFYEYWSVLGDQDEFHVEGTLPKIVTESFSYLSEPAYAAGAGTHSVDEVRPFLPRGIETGTSRVLVLVLSGLRYDAFLQPPPAEAGAYPHTMATWLDELGTDARLCRLRSEVPSNSLPNWVALLMGLRPEIHGLLGNRGPAEQTYSSLLSVTYELKMPAILIGTAWFVDMVRSKVPFGGDGSVSPTLDTFEHLQGERADKWDARREEALHLAMNRTDRLVIAQFSQIDTAGHAHGASYAPDAAYASAIRDKVSLLRQVIERHVAERPDTTLVLLSDHGQLSRGGAGGSSDEERDVPFLVYRPGSGLGAGTPSAACDGGHTMVDVAPSVAALLGVPVPRHSQGSFIADAFVPAPSPPPPPGGGALSRWQWRDLYHQRHAVTSAFLLNPGVNDRRALDELDVAPPTAAALATATASNSSDAAAAAAYAALVSGLDAAAAASRASAASSQSARNQTVAALLLLLVLFLALFAMQNQSFCDPLDVVRYVKYRLWRVLCFWLPGGTGAARPPNSKDVAAASFAAVLVAAYYALTLGAFALFIASAGYRWSSSILSDPDNVWIFLAVTLAPGVGAAYLNVRVLRLRYALLPTSETRLLHRLMFYAVEEVQAYTRMEMLYLVLFYYLFASCAAAATLGVAASRHSFIVPLIFYNKYIDEDLWDYRFAVMTVQIVSVPLLLSSMLIVYRWGRTRIDLQSMSALQDLKVAKAERHGGVAEEGDEVEGVLGGSASIVARPVGMVGSAAVGSAADSGAGVGLGSAKPDEGEAGAAAVAAVAAAGAAGDDSAEKGGLLSGLFRRVPRPTDEPTEVDENSPEVKAEIKARFERAYDEVMQLKDEKVSLEEEKGRLAAYSADLQSELDEIVDELQHNQGLINSGVKELEVLIVRRFEKMQEDEKEEARARAAKKEEEGADDDDEGGGRGAMSKEERRAERRQKLIEEQRRRVAEEERGKMEADAKIRELQAELAKTLEANGRLSRKLEAVEHNVDETRAGIQDLELQISQAKMQKENQLAVVTAETTYLKEHLATVQRKSSELKSKMADIEASISATQYKQQRMAHANELATADQKREIEALEEEKAKLEEKIEATMRDVKVLFNEKNETLAQVEKAKAEADEAEASLEQYRRAAANVVAAGGGAP